LRARVSARLSPRSDQHQRGLFQQLLERLEELRAVGAVEALARSLAAEWAPTIRVNVIAPSLTDTPLAGALLNSDLKKEAAGKRHPLQQVGRSEDMAALVAHLLSGNARFMTGQVLHVDGGLSAVRTF
jgi:NAD(P)-dependent dehydrogenase (short-subunit alcohol dehydrogenase family)